MTIMNFTAFKMLENLDNEERRVIYKQEEGLQQFLFELR